MAHCLFQELEVIQQNELIAQLKDQKQETRVRTGLETNFVAQNATAAVDATAKKSDQTVEVTASLSLSLYRLLSLSVSSLLFLVLSLPMLCCILFSLVSDSRCMFMYIVIT